MTQVQQGSSVRHASYRVTTVHALPCAVCTTSWWMRRLLFLAATPIME